MSFVYWYLIVAFCWLVTCGFSSQRKLWITLTSSTRSHAVCIQIWSWFQTNGVVRKDSLFWPLQLWSNFHTCMKYYKCMLGLRARISTNNIICMTFYINPSYCLEIRKDTMGCVFFFFYSSLYIQNYIWTIFLFCHSERKIGNGKKTLTEKKPSLIFLLSRSKVCYWFSVVSFLFPKTIARKFVLRV